MLRRQGRGQRLAARSPSPSLSPQKGANGLTSIVLRYLTRGSSARIIKLEIPPPIPVPAVVKPEANPRRFSNHCAGSERNKGMPSPELTPRQKPLKMKRQGREWEVRADRMREMKVRQAPTAMIRL